MGKILIEGVDTESALAIMNGNLAGYKLSLASYRRDIPRNIDKIKSSWQKKDYDNFVIYVHGVKGSSRMLGINEIADLFLKLETAGREQDETFIKVNLLKIISQYERYFDILKPFDEASGNKAVKVSEDDTVGNILRDMRVNLEDFEYDEAEKLMKELSGYIFTGREKELMDELLEAMDAIDYYAAMDVTDRLAEEIQKSNKE